MGSVLTDGSEVVVHDVGVDAALVDVAGEPVLVLRPSMSFGAAVHAVLGVAPHLSADEASRLVRRALPQAVNLDEMLDLPALTCSGSCQQAAAPTPGGVVSLARVMRVRMLRGLGGVAVAASVGFGAAHMMNVQSDVTALQAQVNANTNARAPRVAARTPPAAATRVTTPTVAPLEQTRAVEEPPASQDARDATRTATPTRASAPGKKHPQRPGRHAHNEQNATQPPVPPVPVTTPAKDEDPTIESVVTDLIDILVPGGRGHRWGKGPDPQPQRDQDQDQPAPVKADGQATLVKVTDAPPVRGEVAPVPPDVPEPVVVPGDGEGETVAVVAVAPVEGAAPGIEPALAQ